MGRTTGSAFALCVGVHLVALALACSMTVHAVDAPAQACEQGCGCAGRHDRQCERIAGSYDLRASTLTDE